MSSANTASPPSGAQHEIRRGPHRAIVTEVGATLRHYSMNGVEVIDGFGADEWAPSGRGQVLAPWPNRLDRGKYRFEGRDAQAALDEPELQNAIHGLVRWLPWRMASKSADGVALECVLYPQPGYPWQLDLQVTKGFTIGSVQLEAIVSVINLFSEETPTSFRTSPLNSNGWGTPTWYQQPRRWEVGFRLEF